jgi:hypothetical protein
MRAVRSFFAKGDASFFAAAWFDLPCGYIRDRLAEPERLRFAAIAVFLQSLLQTWGSILSPAQFNQPGSLKPCSIQMSRLLLAVE